MKNLIRLTPSLQKWISRGYVLAGAMNILGILFFSKGFTNLYLSKLYPEIFSPFGLLMIILWGLAYIAVASHWQNLRRIAIVFSLEKLVYGLTWIFWIAQNRSDLGHVFEFAPMTALFYMIYGINDFLFMGFFLWAALLANQRR
jgi:hypothetical protein